MRGLMLALAILVAAPQATAAKSVEIKDQHRGIQLVGVSLPPKDAYDIDLMPPAAALANIKRAIDRIYEGSPYSAKHIETLKKNGKVTLVYDAAFPKSRLASVVIAAFFPDFFQAEHGASKEFLVVISRFGVKWPTDKLAAVIVHELVGHGLQHLRGRTAKDRKIDKECEALIYEERAYQDFAVRRDTSDMKQFRRDIRDTWCADFRHHLTRQGQNADKVWNFGKPDIPSLLHHFEAYIRHQRETGVAGDAVAAATVNRAENLAELEAEAKTNGSAKILFQLGGRYLKGIGAKRDPAHGAELIGQAAELGHAQAQHVLGVLHASGFGVNKDMIAAYAWLSLAVERGYPKAKPTLEKIAKAMTPKQRAAAAARAQAWRAKQQS